MKELLAAFDEYSGSCQTVIASKLLMKFACRPGEIRQARWEEFDIDAGNWSISADRMKMRRPHQVPLPQSSLILLKELKELTGWGGLLCPVQTSIKKPVSENTLSQSLRRMGFPADEVTTHCFRSTFTTFANESGL